MKLTVLKGTMLAAAVLMGTGGTAQAMESAVKVDVPFAFTVNGRTLPAGRYLIERDEMSPSILEVRGDQKDNHAAVLVTTIRDGGVDPAGQGRPVLTFTRTENHYRLRGIWDSDDGYDVVGR
jgi:hypothetical protein